MGRRGDNAAVGYPSRSRTASRPPFPPNLGKRWGGKEDVTESLTTPLPWPQREGQGKELRPRSTQRAEGGTPHRLDYRLPHEPIEESAGEGSAKGIAFQMTPKAITINTRD